MDDKTDNKSAKLKDDADVSKQPSTGLQDANSVFNPTIQDVDRSPGLAAARAESADKNDPNRRPTVTVMCGVRSGLVMQLHTLPEDADLPPDYKLGHQQTLNFGANPGIDKKFFEYWKSQNSGLGVVVEGLVTAQDEKQPEPAAKDAGEQDKSADKSSSSTEDAKKK